LLLIAYHLAGYGLSRSLGENTAEGERGDIWFEDCAVLQRRFLRGFDFLFWALCCPHAHLRATRRAARHSVDPFNNGLNSRYTLNRYGDRRLGGQRNQRGPPIRWRSWRSVSWSLPGCGFR